MATKIFPKCFDNDFRGHKLALLLLVVITGFKAIMAFNSVFDTYNIAVSADGIPLDSYPADAAQKLVSIFALLGNLHGIIVALSLLVLVRYRSMVPLIYLILIYEYAARKVINHFLDGGSLWFSWPTGPAGWILQSLFAAMIVGFGLSLWERKSSSPAHSVV